MTQASHPIVSPGECRNWYPIRRRVITHTLFIGLICVVAVAAITWLQMRGRHEAAFARALTALDREEWETVRELARELRSSPAHQSQATFLRGALLFHRGHYYPALDELEQIKDDQDLKSPALTLMGQAWYHLGRHIEAQAAFREVLASAIDSVDAHRWLAASYYDLGAMHDALAHLKRTADLDPQDSRPLRLLGLIYKDYERYEDALPMYEESLRRKADQPDAVDVRLEMATCQLRLRRHREALRTLASCPDLPDIDAVRAECQYAIGDVAQAKETLARALAAQPDHLDVALLRGTILLDEGQTERAVEVLSHAAQRHPHDYMVHLKLAQALTQVQKPRQAEAEHKLAERLRSIREEFAQLHRDAWDRPGDIAVRLRLAELAKELGRPDLADVWLKSAAALQPLSGQTPVEVRLPHGKNNGK